MSRWRRVLEPITRYAGFPCISCSSWCNASSGICARCYAYLPHIAHRCRSCALPLPGPLARCHLCATRDPVLSCVLVNLRYEGLARDLIIALKFNAKLWAARTLARLMLTQAIDLEGEYSLIPIPSVARRLRDRGYNPAHELASCLGNLGGWPVVAGALRRRGYQPPQSTLKEPAERERNVRGVFAIDDAQTIPANVCLIDDVMTTGATLRAAAQCCLENGASNVVACLATRAGLSHNPLI